jgi:hypothetical protein
MLAGYGAVIDKLESSSRHLNATRINGKGGLTTGRVRRGGLFLVSRQLVPKYGGASLSLRILNNVKIRKGPGFAAGLGSSKFKYCMFKRRVRHMVGQGPTIS